jgi:hypothetical protein
MDFLSAVRAVPRFKELYKKGSDRTEAETKEYNDMLAKNPVLADIRLYDEYKSLMAVTGKSDAQEAAVRNFELMHPNIVTMYNNRELRDMLTGKGRRRRTGRGRRARGRGKNTRRR